MCLKLLFFNAWKSSLSIRPKASPPFGSCPRPRGLRSYALPSQYSIISSSNMPATLLSFPAAFAYIPPEKKKQYVTLLLIPLLFYQFFLNFFEYFWIIESLSLDSLIMPPGLRGWRWRVENLIPFPKPPGHVGLDQSHFNANTLSIPGCKAGSA